MRIISKTYHSCLDIWHSHKSAIVFTLRTWGAILICGTFFWALVNSFLNPNLPIDIIFYILFFAIVWSSPYILIFGVSAVVLNKLDFEVKEKKRVLSIVGIFLVFILIENVTGFSKEFLACLGYLLSIPISIFHFKLEGTK